MTTPDAAADPVAALARRELVVVAVVLVALTRAVEPADAFLVAGLLPVVMLLAGVGVLHLDTGGSRPFEALIVPAVLTGGTGAAIHLVPVGLGLVPVLLAFALVLDRMLALELRLLAQATGPSETDMSRVRLAAVVTAFVAFSGIATLVPGGLAEPGGTATGRHRRDRGLAGRDGDQRRPRGPAARLPARAVPVRHRDGRRALGPDVGDRRGRGRGRRPGDRPASPRRAPRC